MESEAATTALANANGSMFGLSTAGVGVAGTLPDYSWITNATAIRDTLVGLQQYASLVERVLPAPWMSEIAQQSWFQGESLIGQSLLSQQLPWLAEVTQQSWFQGEAFAGQGLLAQQALGVAAQISDGLGPSNAVLGEFARITAAITPPSWLPDLSSRLAHTVPSWLPADSFYGARFDALTESLNTTTGPDQRGFAALQHVIDDSPPLRAAVEQVAEAARRPNGFGLDYTAVAEAAEHLDAALEREPEAVERLQQPLHATLADAQLEQSDVIRFATVTGIWNRMRAHRVTGTGVVVGCTVGLLHYVTNLTFAELNPTESVIYGAGAYMWVAGTRGDSEHG